MPPKRKSTESAASGPKKSKSLANSSEVDMETERELNKRWAPVSVSRNAASEFKLRTRDPVKAFSYICLGRAPWKTESTDDESEDEDEEDEELIEQKKKDDAEADKATALEPASEHPREKWIFTNAGIAKWITLQQGTIARDPDNFGMYVYNDFLGYAVMELVENLLLDFDEAAGDWKMQWAICEATGLYFQTDAIMPMVGCDDGETVNAVFIAFGTMFLTMLATLERNGLFKPDSEVKNIGAMIGLFIRFSVDFKEYGIDQGDHGAKIEAYAAKHDVTIHGLNHPRYEKSSDETVELPEATANANDPWGWAKVLAKLKKANDGHLGGDSKDITSWTPAERKKVSFDKKDPITRSDMAHIKNGGIMEMGG
ncbi:hypothetical protein DTO013E5_7047 [Penicillium roqueforti]|uniref:Genomic scaffold, ProqFM164S01 n=1 Tax=Penicillium roqueforti (strain FM164) TaxID=1365484 RepID=W6PSD5_PENRF|nr:uncharacterized protein LCP9604111_3171 [Penicillium roqueforti]CDM26750.1 unnamed protein product [Penicillium roqueforti FM164]KAF9250967.1 hypothetical protein LCP9604111_3171 [Penicillium roqueforti]KAI1833516.1 hypothetical protein CBS147337_5555 [Penicillium roqueforti]KAI2673068.1 hypothetical protein CBS147355_7871 [Penicillium roqueforti]KAI2674769.1 hypothetical protein LCP963914a_8691 [Penicillium roqueforti]